METVASPTSPPPSPTPPTQPQEHRTPIRSGAEIYFLFLYLWWISFWKMLSSALPFLPYRLTVGNCQNNIARKRKLQKVLMNQETKCWNFDLYSSTIHSITASQDLCWQILATAAGDAPRMLSPAAAPPSAGPGPGEARHGAPLPRAGQARTWWDCWVIQT